MKFKRGVALVATWMALSTTTWFGLSAPAVAQVEWKTSLNAAAVPITLTQQFAAGAPDGSVYTMGSYFDSDGSRWRVTRTAASGAVQWVRWTSASNAASRTPLIVHPDSSVTLAYGGNEGACFENFSAAGNQQFRQCISGHSYAYATLAADGDAYLTSEYHRSVKKVSSTGAVRWERIDNNNVFSTVFAAGVNSTGDYFEVLGNRLRIWRATDGTRLSDVTLVGLASNQQSWANKAVARIANETVVIRTAATFSNAVTATVARYGSGGASTWSRELIFPGVGSSDFVNLIAADNDGVYVVLTPFADGDSQVAKLSSTGAILWQKHFSRARRVIDSPNGLLAIRSDAAQASSDSFIFPISIANGSLGSPIIYSRTDAYAPSDWFAAANGVVAVFQGSNPFTPFANYDQTLTATTVFLGSTASNRWIVVAKERPPLSIDQADSLMPRLARSSPSAWWARTRASANFFQADWTTFLPSTGAITARTAQPAMGTGSPITADGGRVIIDYGSPRAKRVDASGTTTWQVDSSVSAASYGQQPLQVVANNDVTTYLIGSVLGRVSAAGTITFETETNRGYPRFLAVDSANNAWAVAGNAGSDGYVSKVSPTGALLWSVPVDAPSCSDSISAARLTANDEMLVATQSCNEGRVFKINAAGQIASQRIVSGTTLRPLVQLKALQVDAAGNIYAGGCAFSSNSSVDDRKGISVIASWSSTGTERWTAQSDVIGGASECITSIATDSANNVYAATSSTVATSAPVLWSFTSAGVERWRHSGVLSAPFAASTELAMDSSDKLLVLGEAPPGSFGPREATVRRINVATLGSSLRLIFLSVPSALIGYRELFPMRIGLRTAADVAINATTPVVVTVALASGTGNLDGSLTCTIAVGASECTVTDARYDVVESGVTASAGADGFATVVSPAFGFTTAATTTTLSTLSVAPYTAFSTVRVRAVVQGPSAPLNQLPYGNLSGPNTANGSNTTNCTTQTSFTSALFVSECDVLVFSGAFPVTAQFSAYDTRYASSTATPLALPVTKVTPSLQITLDPDNTNVAGDRFKLRFTLKVGTQNVSYFVSNSHWTATSGACTNFAFSGSYWTCEVVSAAAGSLSLGVSFAGSDDLLPVNAAAPSANIVLGAVLRGSGLSNLETVCSPTPGVTCSVLQSSGYDWQCVGPAGMSGDIFFIPSPSVTPLFFPNSPLRFTNVVGSVTETTYRPYAVVRSACNADVDGDGARLAMTDGVLILRRMLGLSGAALIAGATNSCAPRSAAGITSAISLPGFDLDGDGQTRAETDGVLLLRALLGFRGDALVANALGTNATRTTGANVLDYLNNTCSFSLQ